MVVRRCLKPSPILGALCFLFTLWWFICDFAVGVNEQYSFRVEHSFDLGHTWLPRGRIHLPLKQETLGTVKPVEINLTSTEIDNLMQLALENQLYFIRATKTPFSELQHPVWLTTSYRAVRTLESNFYEDCLLSWNQKCRLVEQSFRELFLVYLDANLEWIGLGAGYPLHGVCNYSRDGLSRREAFGKLLGYWQVKTPQFPKVALGRKETVQEVSVTGEQSFIEKNVRIAFVFRSF
ncbi:hypothetical protein Gasu_24040 isoform 2 [Galdieria sulphuraria]|uniref:Uncharacterized protein n=1 Tax=Galdieria sulphuraria TaxID=130081 RepID=M2W3G6_GALSU|nr:hypothetical protein Gasu_24040 isoform 2 [Galdieria sulphuraria]EME30251.1 hypothetical protein isoform 2 [Galdieria sulphuraria]|eukprot:XP_005706771.1 hypothetical protein isoform 2 [Galdieria sulphuraria]